MTIQRMSSFWHLPSTKLGRWAVGLAAVPIILFLAQDRLVRFLYRAPITYQLPIYKTWWITSWIWEGPGLSRMFFLYRGFMLIWGVAAGIVGLVAMIKKHERSWLVWIIVLLGILLGILSAILSAALVAMVAFFYLCVLLNFLLYYFFSVSS
jgi:hypothetical protein